MKSATSRPSLPAPRAVMKPKPAPAAASVLRWEEPPRAVRGAKRGWIEDVLPELKDHPDRWALVKLTATRHDAARMATLARKGGKRWGWTLEAVARTLPDGRCGVYARWLSEAP